MRFYTQLNFENTQAKSLSNSPPEQPLMEQDVRSPV